MSCELHNPLVVMKWALSSVGRGDFLRHWLCDPGHGRRHEVSNDSRILGPSLYQALLSFCQLKRWKEKYIHKSHVLWELLQLIVFKISAHFGLMPCKCR